MSFIVVVVELVAHAAAVEADIVPVGCVIKRGAVEFADFPQPSVTIDFVNRDAVVDLDLLPCEAVPLIKQILGFFVAQVFGVGLARQSFVVSLLHVVGVLVWLPLLLALQSFLQLSDPGLVVLGCLLGCDLGVYFLHVCLVLDLGRESVGVLFVCLAKCVLVAVKICVIFFDNGIKGLTR